MWSMDYGGEGIAYDTLQGCTSLDPFRGGKGKSLSCYMRKGQDIP